MGNIFHVIAPGENLLNRTPPAQDRAPRINRWNPMKLESFCTQRKLSESLRNERKSSPTVLQMGRHT